MIDFTINEGKLKVFLNTNISQSYMDFSFKEFNNILESVEFDDLTIEINSLGGDVTEMLAICSKIKDIKDKQIAVTTKIKGIAASAAAVIFSTGNKRIMDPETLVMIHNPWTLAAGNTDELRKAADDLEKVQSSVFNYLKNAVTCSEEELEDLLKKEIYLTTQEAKNIGLATEIITLENKDISYAASLKGISRVIADALNKKDIIPASEGPEYLKKEDKKRKSKSTDYISVFDAFKKK